MRSVMRCTNGRTFRPREPGESSNILQASLRRAARDGPRQTDGEARRLLDDCPETAADVGHVRS
jgi:hypothetical protein